MFPAGAGVILNRQGFQMDILSVPCGCRGDPTGTIGSIVIDQCSLRVQG